MKNQSSGPDYQSDLQFYLVLALALMSFLFLLTVILVILMKLRKSGNPKFLQCLAPVPHSKAGAIFPPNFEDGTLPYSYQLCLSSESRKNELTFLTPNIQIAGNVLGNGDLGMPLTGNEENHLKLEMENTEKWGANFTLKKAEDPDIGINSLQNYHLSPNQYFTLEVREGQEGNKYAELVLQKPLDREGDQTLHLTLLALDGGEPRKTGTAQIWVNVTDANDNPPIFTQEVYQVSMKENTPVGSPLLQVAASDSDEGSNAYVTYSFSNIAERAHQKFKLDPKNGIITIQEMLDFEETDKYSMSVEAKDGGGLVAHCKVEVKVIDENDNAPEVVVASLFSPIPEDSPSGTVAALISVKDRDSGENGKCDCHLQRNSIEFRMQVKAQDEVDPPLACSNVTVWVFVLDQNDNSPRILYPTKRTLMKNDITR
uniref:Uncharacterized protein n=1 Tax=Sphaerodactylus townsendi TaxID=933632 RepID=A0ACB8EBQ9_9SAUR